MKSNEGCKGQGHTGYSKYGAASAPVTKNGGNTAIQDSVVSNAGQSSVYGDNLSNVRRSKKVNG